MGSLSWLLAPGSQGVAARVAAEIARSAASLAKDGSEALIILERETGLQDAAETGVTLHAELSAELLCTIFTPHAPLHDGAVLVRGEEVVAAGVVLPLSEIIVHRERYGTRHRAALGITEQTDAIAVVVSEETGTVSLVERGRIVRDLDEERLRAALYGLLEPTSARGRVSFALASSDRSSWDRRLRLRSLRGRRASTADGRDGDRAPASRKRTGVPPAGVGASGVAASVGAAPATPASTRPPGGEPG